MNIVSFMMPSLSRGKSTATPMLRYTGIYAWIGLQNNIYIYIYIHIHTCNIYIYNVYIYIYTLYIYIYIYILHVCICIYTYVHYMYAWPDSGRSVPANPSRLGRASRAKTPDAHTCIRVARHVYAICHGHVLQSSKRVEICECLCRHTRRYSDMSAIPRHSHCSTPSRVREYNV